ncbi:hypothetical protein FIA58_003125 [Flavobacterium jejuense]|uniref:Uncharacterized protein n=1 Tax=Flavobacterium jejuense TaxID=1544455 RepID=A0ABX0INY8_9FLAO|nr:hypothetical protein [Flavobacterium jejuense]NHN24657.1 hypothetical protein [Flavobacterium jejuense]
MKHPFYIVILIIIGFLINPTESYGCSKKKFDTEKTCCSSQNDLNFHKKECSDKEEQKSCDGSCNSSNCNFSPIYSSIITEEIVSIFQKNEIILTSASNFFYLEKNTSLNYFAIWSPPKIS